MSFWMVPRNLCIGTPCRLPTAITIASKMAAGALMVMLMLTLSSGMPSSSTAMSSRLGMLTPTLPTSPNAIRSSES